MLQTQTVNGDTLELLRSLEKDDLEASQKESVSSCKKIFRTAEDLRLKPFLGFGWIF